MISSGQLGLSRMACASSKAAADQFHVLPILLAFYYHLTSMASSYMFKLWATLRRVSSHTKPMHVQITWLTVRPRLRRQQEQQCFLEALQCLSVPRAVPGCPKPNAARCATQYTYLQTEPEPVPWRQACITVCSSQALNQWRGGVNATMRCFNQCYFGILHLDSDGYVSSSLASYLLFSFIPAYCPLDQPIWPFTVRRSSN